MMIGGKQVLVCGYGDVSVLICLFNCIEQPDFVSGGESLLQIFAEHGSACRGFRGRSHLCPSSMVIPYQSQIQSCAVEYLYLH